MSFFQNSVLNKYIQSQDKETVQAAYRRFSNYFHSAEIQENIRNSKEEQFQEGFLRELFVNVLGYVLNPNPNYNLTTELKNEKGSKKADGAILQNGGAVAVIELKGTDTKDLDKINAQAFNYKNNQRNCVYVITSNFERLRFFIHNAVEHIEFNLFSLSEDDFQLLWLCLSADSLLKGIPLKAKKDSLVVEEKITKQLYKDYSAFRSDLWQNMIKNRSDADRLLLFKKTQKLLDRFLFIFFAEDKDLLPPNSISEIVKQWNKLKELDEYRPLYDRFKKYFGYLNTGWQGKAYEIFAYNGGLFLPDELLDSITIDDDILHQHVVRLTGYDFQSEVDVNILGHIFENSLNEIENINAELSGQEVDKSKTKRKKDGVFYTPKYITKYIVDNTIGRLCKEKKAALGIVDEEFAKGRRNRQKQTIKKLDNQLKAYRAWLLDITICDPACGSGAFLNQALEFLIAEHAFIDELNAQLFGASIVFQDVSNHILEKNLFGVDINEESVEIAKLSLWLRTAQRGRKLTTLNKNIKCGNSLIDDPEVAGEKAFKWQQEFPTIFQPKAKNAYHITWATHNSRTSQRMIDHKVKKVDALWLEPEQERIITETIADIIKEDQLNVMAYNICGDHVHLLLVCQEEELPNIIRKLKGKSSQKLKEHQQIPKEETFTLWAQKYGTTYIESDEQLWNTVDYIQTNRLKHELPPLYTTSEYSGNSGSNKGLQPLVLRSGDEIPPIIRTMCCDYDYAFRVEYQGGFDVVIGNPPYVRQELLGPYKPYFEKRYSVFEGTTDLFAYFYELSFILLNKNGLFSFISNTFDKTKAAEKLRSYLTDKVKFLKYVDFTKVQIFEGATTYPIILVAQNSSPKKQVFSYIKISKSSQSKLIEIDNEEKISVAQETLSSMNWDFKSIAASEIFNKLKQHKSIKNKFGKSYRGIVTGFNEAFIIEKITKEKLELSHLSSSELIKPFYEGKDMNKWTSPKIEKYLIFTRRGTEINKYPAIEHYLSQNRERLTPRNSPEQKIGRKPGPYLWFEIQDSVDYYEYFEGSKIIWPNLQSQNKFCFDDQGFYINAPSAILPSNNKALLSILNSKIVWFFLKSICVVRSGGYIEVKPQYFEQIPIPELKNEDDFEKKANKIIDKTAELQQLQTQFIDLLQSKFEIDKLSKNLENWYKLEFKSFVKELQKKKINLGLSEEAEWMKYFNEQKQKAEALVSEINQIEKEIDQMVYELYGLTEEEIKIIEEA